MLVSIPLLNYTINFSTNKTKIVKERFTAQLSSLSELVVTNCDECADVTVPEVTCLTPDVTSPLVKLPEVTCPVVREYSL